MTPHTLITLLIGAFGSLRRELRPRTDEDEVATAGYSEWAGDVDDMLTKTGQNAGFVVDTCNITATHGEVFLLVWQKQERGHLASVPLAAVCEWEGPARILEAFNQLLLTRATIRVMVCDATKLTGGATIVANWLRELVGTFDGQRGDTYLLAALDETDGKWDFELHEILAQGPGQRPVVQKL